MIDANGLPAQYAFEGDSPVADNAIVLHLNDGTRIMGMYSKHTFSHIYLTKVTVAMFRQGPQGMNLELVPFSMPLFAHSINERAFGHTSVMQGEIIRDARVTNAVRNSSFGKIQKAPAGVMDQLDALHGHHES